ncbi:MAG: response regulator [candidate division Zixibacteria bacterium]|nr:response regulator [candidate division Zixibacteria bacterium]NIS46837.1 response regulator [candidate division Zixibacteria bacterium]NIU14982.1 response regulator [candidate division Zixibacteria bacterium]NIV06998.1 response regulator [candidate division Zixibacteria bacterium]NIW42331.1 response regulator [candidate division Zixibacteria bacterium]
MSEKGKKILIVDDEGIIRDCCMKALSARGYDVHTAEDGQEGLNKICDNHYDVIFLDLVMPRMDGQAVAHNISGLSEQTKIIVISGSSTDEAQQKARDMGAHFYLEKPFTPSDLVDAIRSVTAEVYKQAP